MDRVLGVAVVTFRRTALVCLAAVKVCLVMTFPAVNLLHGLSAYVFFVFRAGMTLPAVKSFTMHRVLVRIDLYTKAAFPACLAVTSDAVLRFIAQGRGDTGLFPAYGSR